MEAGQFCSVFAARRCRSHCAVSKYGGLCIVLDAVLMKKVPFVMQIESGCYRMFVIAFLLVQRIVMAGKKKRASLQSQLE